MKGLKTDRDKMLLVAIGNSGRGDDGLGWKFADLAQESGTGVFDVAYRYQLQVEDAELISHYDIVIFADASQEDLENGFGIKSIKASGHFFYTSHVQSPQAVLFLAETLFGKSPSSYLLGITGYEWELKTSISEKASANLQSALVCFNREYLKIQTGHRTSI